MSTRVEWADVAHVGATLHGRGDVLADGQRVTSGVALVFDAGGGHFAIEGDRDSLRRLVDALRDIL